MTDAQIQREAWLLLTRRARVRPDSSPLLNGISEERVFELARAHSSPRQLPRIELAIKRVKGEA